MTEEKVKQYLALPRSVADQLDAAVGRGATKSGIVANALVHWFKHGGDDELELRFARRLNRMSKAIIRLERNSNVDLESQAQFFRDMLTISPAIPEDDDVARALGEDRFNAFVARVGQRLAKGRRTFGDDDDDEEEK